MREHPILFSGPMVRAILDGRKTMTRRVVKPMSGRMVNCKKGAWKSCPYGRPGSALWVRETWATERCYDKTSPAKLPRANRPRIHYLADGPKPSWAGRTRSSRFMPRRASRLTLEITAVRVERVQDISAEDVQREGLDVVGNLPAPFAIPKLTQEQAEALVKKVAQIQFRKYWDSLNAKRGHGWDANDWVWATTFRRVKGE